MISLSQPTKIADIKGNTGTFVIEGLYPGYGITIGNSLRRVLLSSLEGAAVTQVKIKGVAHEFATIPGVLEDVISVLLNLKQLRFRMHTDEPQRATLKIKGEKEVKGSDFAFPAQLELVSHDAPIAHLTTKAAELEMEIQVEKGTGYVPTEAKTKEKNETGVLALDAIYTPVKRVSSRVENMRVGDQTDYNRLTIEVETDGTLSPEEAFYQAADVLVKQFGVVMDGVREAAEKKAAVQKEEPKEKKKAPAKKAAKKAVKKVAKKPALPAGGTKK